ncbi:MAG TPA: C_GCAxxG_C_C family protein [Candidatus Egerieimonas intestinavium]|uniref:C_GCAxxG_C_C family protein n=1 Tax=Candidatus Egerieimonas intestinavium TaxID=2840777 RepID=A0A9D1EK56_9FIRM|nr:C_GCAxxG_C_C family protein [Candidatus Egerieimonas intestinavium]
MKSRVEKTMENHKKGYNCAQSVACAYCDLVGMDEASVFRMTEGFGAGMGGMDCTCGALSGAVALAGLKNSQGNAQKQTKGSTYKLSKELVRRFREKNQTVICRELKGLETGQVLRSCDGCIRDAARLAEELLFGEEE